MDVVNKLFSDIEEIVIHSLLSVQKATESSLEFQSSGHCGKLGNAECSEAAPQGRRRDKDLTRIGLTARLYI